MNETKFTQKLIRRLKELGYLVHKTSERFSSGWPDLVACRDGKVYFIEVKVDGNSLSALQRHKLKELSKEGMLTFVVWYKNKTKREEWYLVRSDEELMPIHTNDTFDFV